QLNGLNNKLVFQITCERKSHVDLNAKQLKEIESLKSKINLKDSEITSLEVRINELEARLLASSKSEKLCENFTYDPSCSSIEQENNSSLEIRVKELKNELEKVTQNSSFKDGLIFCLRSRVSDLERKAKKDELDQFASQLHQISHDSKIGSAEADYETKISETLCSRKNLPIENPSSSNYKYSA
ncbi:6196_t:CDS:1, partial [Rhizophagus irregularis]